MLRKVFNGIAAVVTLLAVATAGAACYWFLYQPRVPKSLR